MLNITKPNIELIKRASGYAMRIISRTYGINDDLSKQDNDTFDKLDTVATVTTSRFNTEHIVGAITALELFVKHKSIYISENATNDDPKTDLKKTVKNAIKLSSKLKLQAIS